VATVWESGHELDAARPTSPAAPMPPTEAPKTARRLTVPRVEVSVALMAPMLRPEAPDGQGQRS
jgi:hypothetical protein